MHGRLLLHVDVWLFATTPDFLAVSTVVHHLAQRCYFLLLVFEVDSVQRILSSYGGHSPERVSLVFLLEVHGQFGLYFVGRGFGVVLPTGCVAGPSCAGNAHATLPHHALAQLIGFNFLVVPDQLNALLVSLAFAKHILVLAQQVAQRVPKVLLPCFPDRVHLHGWLSSRKGAVLRLVPGEGPVAAEQRVLGPCIEVIDRLSAQGLA